MNWWVRSIRRFLSFQTILNIFLFLGSAIAGYISISAFISLLGIPIGITSFAIELKICTITIGIKKCKSIIRKKKKPCKRIVLVKTNLNSIEVVISNTATDPYISHFEFDLVNIVLKEYGGMKKEDKHLKTLTIN